MRIHIIISVLVLAIMTVSINSYAGLSDRKKKEKSIDYRELTLNHWKSIYEEGDSQLRQTIYDYIDQEKIKYEKVLMILQNIAVTNNSLEVSSKASNDLVLLYNKYSGSNIFMFDEAVSWEGTAVYQNDKLLNLGKMNFPEITLFATETNDGMHIVEGGWEAASIGTFGTSESRMKAGLAPNGPDGQVVLLCKLVRTDQAPLYELSNTRSVELLNGVKSNMYLKEACLSEAASSSYWLERVPKAF